jgi:cyclopropane-fatty-acyl-phospholipid synthase
MFFSLNPHSPPDPRLIHKRMILSHPQFSRSTLEAREAITESFQGKDGLWFCGTWTKYGFHEDGCRSGFKVATAISKNSLPWAEGSGELVLSAPDLSKTAKSSGIIRAVKNTLSYSLPVTICRRMIYSFLRKAGNIHVLISYI